MPYAGHLPQFERFQRYLVGTWQNHPLPGGKDDAGGPSNPLSYNVMPLPQQATQPGGPWPYPGYILKNFRYFEMIRFNDNGAPALATPATAPNRGGMVNQIAHALFYDQKVSFAEGPNKGSVVHIENGSWITVKIVPQIPGPYAPTAALADPTVPDVTDWPGIITQPSDVIVAKQIAVPHGNSVLALGHIDTYAGSSEIPTATFPLTPKLLPGSPAPYPLPHRLQTNRYNEPLTPPGHDFENPNVELTQNPNAVLQTAVDLIDPDKYIHWRVTTEQLPHGKGSVTNIPFEDRRAKVTEYVADYWLLHAKSERDKDAFRYLSYTQTILMEMRIGPPSAEQTFVFPHVTCNTVTKV